ncbi:hypothetical protein K438DRAFT_1754837 [Mycena galopus ATCC 62051]|nr:hypothetical protein K438DRAFT_1754837 [Mycena galopus ATCC 62051]
MAQSTGFLHGASGQQQITSLSEPTGLPHESASWQIAQIHSSERERSVAARASTYNQATHEEGSGGALTHATTFHAARFPSSWIESRDDGIPHQPMIMGDLLNSPLHPYLLNSSQSYHIRADCAEAPYNASLSRSPSTGGHQTINNIVHGGTGGSGGGGHGQGTGGPGGSGMGPTLNYEIRTGSFTMNNVKNRGLRKGIDLLQNAAAAEALHDSAESFPQPKCHPETRTKMLKDLRRWCRKRNPASTIIWLYGPAGAGKSAIMQTLARKLQSAGRLGASFFFKRGHSTRSNGNTLFATIAYQLALEVPWLKAPISQVVEDNPSIISRSIANQLEKLICQPCHLPAGEIWDPVTIIVDGLDECEGQGMQEEILRAIRTYTAKYSLPLRFIIASRPESHIRELFTSPFYEGAYCPFNVEQSFEDVRRYLLDEFSRIHHEHHLTMVNIPSPWPSPEILSELVLKSSGHFIYASTIIKFVDDKNYRPTERLAMVQDTSSPGSESAFDPIDQLYLTILRSAPRETELVPILCAITNFGLSTDGIDQLLGLAHGDARLLLRGVHSVLEVPLDNKDEISLHHTSFLDFLNNPRRSQNFYVGGLHHQMDLARSFLELCAGQYPKLGHPGLGFPGIYGPSLYPEFSSPGEAMIPFVISLPPSPELLSLIQRMHPNYIFELAETSVGHMLSWLKAIPSAPQDLINLWEDYAYMSAFLDTVAARFWSHSNPPPFSVQHIISQVPDLLRILLGILLTESGRKSLRYIRPLLDTTWDHLRATICSLRSNNARDEKILEGPLDCIQAPTFPEEPYDWPSLSRDLARQCIHMFKADIEAGHPANDHPILVDLRYLVRASPPCPALYQDLRAIMPLLYNVRSTKWIRYHVCKWLESFPNPPLKYIASQWESLRIRDEDAWLEESHWASHMKMLDDVLASLHCLHH